MHDLEIALVRLSWKHRGDLSDKTLARERADLKHMARVLVTGGYSGLKDPAHIKGRHRDFLLDVWHGRRPNPLTGVAKALQPGVKRVYVTSLRKWGKWAGKPALIAKLNANPQLAIESRDRIPDVNRAWRLRDEDLARLRHEHVSLALRGQALYGLREKEAFLVRPGEAHITVAPGDKLRVANRDVPPGEYLHLTRGTKGGRPRVVPVRTEAQRQWVAEAKAFADSTPRSSMVPGASLEDAFKDYRADMKRAHLTGGHGLRHQYAQDRYHELTGWACSRAGGLPREALIEADQRTDQAAREILAEELGHGGDRWQKVTAVYIGK